MHRARIASLGIPFDPVTARMEEWEKESAHCSTLQKVSQDNSINPEHLLGTSTKGSFNVLSKSHTLKWSHHGIIVRAMT